MASFGPCAAERAHAPTWSPFRRQTCSTPEDPAMIELTLPDMTCGHCVRTVTQTVQRLDPQATVQTDLPTHTAKIETTASPEAVRAALADEGYPAR